VYFPENLSMSLEDVRQDLRIILLNEVRKFARKHNKLPDEQLVRHILKRRTQVLIRNSQVPYRRNEQFRPKEGEISDDAWQPSHCETPDRIVEDGDRRRITEVLVYALRRTLPPGQFALMHLRYVEGLMPAEIAQRTGHDASTVNKRLTFARKRALAYLQSMGIETWTDTGQHRWVSTAIETLSPEDIRHDID
jgi:RNA polymerase sigma factor (sigma-70 family)